MSAKGSSAQTITDPAGNFRLQGTGIPLVLVASIGRVDEEFEISASPAVLELKELRVEGRLVLKQQPKANASSLWTVDLLVYNDGTRNAETSELRFDIVMNGGSCTGGLANVHKVKDMILADLDEKTARSGGSQYPIVGTVASWFPSAANRNCLIVKLDYKNEIAAHKAMRIRVDLSSASIGPQTITRADVELSFDGAMSPGGTLKAAYP